MVLLFCSFSILVLLDFFIGEAKDLPDNEDFLLGNLDLFLVL